MSGVALGLGLGIGRARALRSSLKTPFDLGGKLLEWWNADRADLITLSGSQVSAWTGSKAGLIASQATTIRRPIYGATDFNGAPCLTFDGADDNLAVATNPFPIGSDPVEFWSVLSQDALVADTGFRFAMSHGNAGTSTRRYLARDVSAGNIRIFAAFGSVVASSAGMSGRLVARAALGTNLLTLYRDGALVASVTAFGNSSVAAPFYIGANGGTGNFWLGKFRDVIVTQPLDVNEAAWMTSYLMNRRMP